MLFINLLLIMVVEKIKPVDSREFQQIIDKVSNNKKISTQMLCWYEKQTRACKTGLEKSHSGWKLNNGKNIFSAIMERLPEEQGILTNVTKSYKIGRWKIP